MINVHSNPHQDLWHLAAILLAFAGATCATRAAAEAPPPSPPDHIKDYGLRDYVRLSKDLPHTESQAWKLVCTMPYNCHFQPWIELDAPAGKELRFNSSNPLVLYLTPTETVTTSEGPQIHEAKHWVSGEGASVSSTTDRRRRASPR